MGGVGKHHGPDWRSGPFDTIRGRALRSCQAEGERSRDIVRGQWPSIFVTLAKAKDLSAALRSSYALARSALDPSYPRSLRLVLLP
jgi:hypothetical protein